MGIWVHPGFPFFKLYIRTHYVLGKLLIHRYRPLVQSGCVGNFQLHTWRSPITQSICIQTKIWRFQTFPQKNACHNLFQTLALFLCELIHFAMPGHHPAWTSKHEFGNRKRWKQTYKHTNKQITYYYALRQKPSCSFHLNEIFLFLECCERWIFHGIEENIEKT